MLYLSTPTFNELFEAGLNVQNIIKLTENDYIILFFGNILLSLIVGVVPAIVAANKDPIKALKSVL